MAAAPFTEGIVQAALRELDVDRKARDAGRLGEPRAESVTPDAAHQEIVAYFSERLRASRARTEAELARLQADREAVRAQIDLAQARDALARLPHALAPEIQALKHRHADGLFEAKKAEEQAARNLRWYQRAHGLQDEAHYPASPLQHFAAVAVIAVLEWISLSAFYAEGSDYGLLGGVLIAMALSVVNISLAVLAGSLARYFNHRSHARKLLAALGAAFLVGCFVLTTLAAAHYRVAANETAAAAALAAGESEQWRAAKAAGQRLAAQPLGFGDVFSWIVIVAAIVFGIFAAYKGYRIDDPYPGYGERERLRRRRRERFRELKAAYLEELEIYFARVQREQQALVSRLRRDIDYFAAKCRETERRAQELNDEIAGLRDACDVVIRNYRDENTHVAGLPRPAYFDAPARLDERLAAPCRALLDEERRTLARYEQALPELAAAAQRNEELVQRSRADELRRLEESFDELSRRVRDDLSAEAAAP